MNQQAMKEAKDHDPMRPGKFEGEQAATVYFYFCGLDGEADDTYDFGGDGSVDLYEVFQVSEEERHAFGLKERHYAVHHSDQGFISGWQATGCYLNDLRAEYDVHCADKDDSDPFIRPTITLAAGRGEA